MKKSHKISILVVLGIILFIGIVIPKLTVRDIVSLTAKEKSCAQTGIRQQFDHPFQRIALWLGKSAVVSKQGDGIIKANTLVVKSYTIFRIPLPSTRFFNRFTQHVICDGASEKVGGIYSEAGEFTGVIQGFVIKNFGQPIEGFSAPIYLNAFPGLLKADFDRVKTGGGKYVYENGELIFKRTKAQPISTAEEAISKEGHQTLFENVRGRLGSDLLVDEIIKSITAQGLGKITGAILFGPTCPVLRDLPDSECTDKPIFGDFIVQNAMGTVEFTRFGTQQDGSFSVTLPAGEYYITWAEPKGPGIQGRLVNVVAGETIEVAIAFDTGIR